MPLRSALPSLIAVFLLSMTQAHTAASFPPDWWAHAQDRIAEMEYEVSWQERPGIAGLPASWQAPNRAQGFRSYFTGEGIRLVPRTADAASWQWGLRLTAIGREEDALPVEPAIPTATGNRVTYDRGSVLEWYLNDSRGLEQGFTLAALPEGGQGPLALVFVLDGDLSPVVSAEGRAIDFVTATGARALRYAGLRVTDASGRELEATMEGWSASEMRGIKVWIEDSDAVWPLSVDPLLTSPAWTTESNQTDGLLGSSVATAGDVNGDGFSEVIVGAPGFDIGQSFQGRAFVFHGSAAGLSLTPNWTAQSNGGPALFGSSVATAGDVNGDGYSDVIVGAPRYGDKGRAFVYLGSALGLPSTPNWTSEADQFGANFGFSVATAGDVNGDGYSDVIVGAYLRNNTAVDEGRAYVYLGSASGLSTSIHWMTGGDQPGAFFGYSVGTTGDVDGDGYADVIVGAPGFNSYGGLAFLYRGSAAGLSLTSNWTAPSDQAGAEVGISVGTAGDVNGDGYADVIVGAHGYDNGESDEGRVFVFHGSAAGPAANANWAFESDQAGGLLGFSSGTAGDVNGDGYADVIVGAHGFDGGQTDEGRAFVFHGSAAGLSPTANWTAESNQPTARFGVSVSTAGDVNGDGYSDVIVGADSYGNGQSDEGRAFVYLGSASSLSPSMNWMTEGNQPGASFGYSVSTAGDVNGDGYADLIVGAPNFDNGQNDEGRALVYHGSAAGLPLTPNWTTESDQAGASLGLSVGTAGDVNGDGYADVIVGAPYFSHGQSGEGRALVYHGSAAGLSLAPSWTTESNQTLARLGFSVATAGDVNGDGYTDVIVGAPNFDSILQDDEGRAFVHHGSPTGLSMSPNWTTQSTQPGAQLGFSVATAGDVNGDGYADVIVGARYSSNGQTGEGRAFVYHGNTSGLSPTPNWSAEGDQVNALFGSSVGTAGDTNGDGYADVIVGAPQFESEQGQVDEGRAVVYQGSASGLSPAPSWSPEADQPGAWLGFSVGTAGDVNGDGYADVVVGAPNFDNGQSDEGGAFLFQGNGGAGLSLRPQQRRSDDAAPIAPLGMSGSADSFRLAAVGRTPFGRGAVRAEWEIKGLGTLFDGNGIQAGVGWSDTGTTGVALDELVPGLMGSTVYHWRLRLRYHPVTSPFQSRSRWLTVPWNGWQEGDLRTSPSCQPPTQQISIAFVRVSADGNRYPIFDYEDGNPQSQVTGYNVYRTSDPSISYTSWPKVASNVVDMDPITIRNQWVDTSGDVPPGGIWYYQITAFNAQCSAEGPF